MLDHQKCNNSDTSNRQKCNKSDTPQREKLQQERHVAAGSYPQAIWAMLPEAESPWASSGRRGTPKYWQSVPSLKSVGGVSSLHS